MGARAGHGRSRGPAVGVGLYLKFADGGSQGSFEDVPDLTADEFREYAGYFID